MGGPLTTPNYWTDLAWLWAVLVIALPVCIVAGVISAIRNRRER